MNLDFTELYLVEGDSAGGSADSGRDAQIQAILPLRGKILNVEKAQLVKLFGNKEIRNMFQAIGVVPGEEMDVDKRRYGKIILMMDADVDGSHIRTLLLTFLFRLMRPLVKAGCVYVAQTPLYRVLPKGKKKATPRYVQSHEEMRKELTELGLDGASVFVKQDGTVFEGENLAKIVQLISAAEEPLLTLERRGIDLRYLSHHHLSRGQPVSQISPFHGTRSILVC